MTPKISILLPAYKSKDLLNHVFMPGYLKNTTVETELLIYDNGGNGIWDNDGPIIDCRKGVVAVGCGKNLGLNKALNILAEKAQGEYFYLPHTDMYLMPGWDTALLEAVKNQPPGRQLLCSRSVEPTKGHTDFHLIESFGMEWGEFDEENLLKAFKGYRDYTIVTGYRMPFFMHRELWEKMEDFNEKFLGKREGVDSNYFSYATDNDLFITSYEVGVRSFWMVYGSLVYHLQGKSNKQQVVDSNSRIPYEYFEKKWLSKYNTGLHIDSLEQSLCPWYVKIR